MSLERLAYDAEAGGWRTRRTRPDGPAAGRHTFEATAFIARLVAHIPDKGQVLQRAGTGACPYIGYYANRTRGELRKAAQAGGVAGDGPLAGAGTGVYTSGSGIEFPIGRLIPALPLGQRWRTPCR